MDNERHAIDEDAAKLAAKLLGARGGRGWCGTPPTEEERKAAQLLGARGGIVSRNHISPKQQEKMQEAKNKKFPKGDPRKGKKIAHAEGCQNKRCRGGCRGK